MDIVGILNSRTGYLFLELVISMFSKNDEIEMLK
jgi:hypothetical protein